MEKVIFGNWHTRRTAKGRRFKFEYRRRASARFRPGTWASNFLFEPSVFLFLIHSRNTLGSRITSPYMCRSPLVALNRPVRTAHLSPFLALAFLSTLLENLGHVLLGTFRNRARFSRAFAEPMFVPARLVELFFFFPETALPPQHSLADTYFSRLRLAAFPTWPGSRFLFFADSGSQHSHQGTVTTGGRSEGMS